MTSLVSKTISFRKIQFVGILLAAIMAVRARAMITVTPQEMAKKHQWAQQHLLNATNQPPFSFTFAGLPSSTLLRSWSRTERDTVLSLHRTQHVITWSNNTLEVKCVAVEYNDYPVVEWTVWLKNIGKSNTPIIQNVQGLDTVITRTNAPEFVLHTIQGDSATPNSYEPYQVTLGPSTSTNFGPPSYSGKSCDGRDAWPYYNLQVPGGGIIMAIGWPGEWAASFVRDAGNDLQVKAGQQLTHLYLKPGEQIRTPLSLLLFWGGTNVVRAQNIWRHFYMAHVIPKVDGQPPSIVLQVQGDSSNVVNSYIQTGIHPNILWRDAGAGGTTWYPSNNGPYKGANQWLNTGTWEVDTNLYPNGFGPTSKAINTLGVKFLLWFEPERVGNTNSSWLATNHPSWLLPGTSTTVGDILNEGNPSAFNWLTNHFEALIQSNGVGWYREDMNGGGPLPAWRNHDTADREGITENFYVQGHLAYWDALLAMNPGLRIDCCGSGGRRNDLEAMMRGVPLTRSDYLTGDMETVANGNQCQTYGLSFWLPFQGAASYFTDPYSFRSFYMASFGMVYRNNDKQAYDEDAEVAPIMLNGDYYPLTPYSLSNNVWMAWQFDWPEKGEGCVQIWRRTNSLMPSMTFRLHGLVSGKLYRVHDFDTGNLGSYSGRELMTTGVTIRLNPRQSAILVYTNVEAITMSAGGSPLIGPQGMTVQFNAVGTSVSGAPVSFVWDFGDGDTATNQDPNHTYRFGGRYIAQVTGTDGQGNTNIIKIPVTVLSETGWVSKMTFPSHSGSQTITNIPILVVFGTNDMPNGFSYSQVASSNGWDLVFMSSNQTALLNYQIEEWNTNGNSYVWVQVPRLNTNTVIWAHWGDTNLASTPAPCMTNGSVWSNGYTGVWHLANGVVLSGADSIPGSSPGTVYGAKPTSGVVDGACQFNGANSYIDFGTNLNPMSNGEQATMSAWVYPKAGTVLMMKGNDNAVNSYGLEWSGNSSLLFTYANTTDWLSDEGKTPANKWSYLSGVIDGNHKYLYVDGALAASNTFVGSLLTTNYFSIWLGAQDRTGYNYFFDGTMDEVRLSSVARSPSWIRTEYMTMASNRVFSAYSPVIRFKFSSFSSNLSIRLAGTNEVVAWSTQFGTNAVLQESVNLLNWTNSTAPVVVSGTSNMIILRPRNEVMFYRLKY